MRAAWGACSVGLDPYKAVVLHHLDRADTSHRLRRLRCQAWERRAVSVGAEGPTVIPALQSPSRHASHRQRGVAVGATIIESEQLARLQARDHKRLVEQRNAQRL